MTRAQTFGAYELLDRISAGGMAEVYRARDTRRNTVVALKRILPHIAEDEEFTTMFEDEARIASQLEHPHIARTLDYGQVAGTYFIAFEYVHGKDLRALFERCRKIRQHPPLPFLLYAFTRIGEGLSYAHARRDAAGGPVSIVHRDVSPQNLVVSTDGDVKLIDFGIAKAEGKASRTQAGTIKGKFGYMSPEQIRGDEVDACTDVFSMGICMWELFTLERLYEEPNELLVLKKIRDYDVPPPSRINSSIPPELDRIVLRALAREREQRYRSARDLYRDLNAFSESKQWVAKRDDIAQYMRRMFPELGASPEVPSAAGLGLVPRANGGAPPPGLAAGLRQESDAMGAKNANQGGGSDLDIFEGLGKARPQAPRGEPARAAEAGMINARKTLMGLSAPAPQPSPNAASRHAAVRPAAGRPSLPDVTAPPRDRTAYTASFSGPAPANQAPPAAFGAGPAAGYGSAPPPAYGSVPPRGSGPPGRRSSAPPPAYGGAPQNLPGYTTQADTSGEGDPDWDEDEATQVMRESSKSAMWALTPPPPEKPAPAPARGRSASPPALVTTLASSPAPAAIAPNRPPPTGSTSRPPPNVANRSTAPATAFASATTSRPPPTGSTSRPPPPAVAIQAPPPPPPPPLTASAFRTPGPPPPNQGGGILLQNTMPLAGGPGGYASPAMKPTVPSGAMARAQAQQAPQGPQAQMRPPPTMNRTVPMPTMQQQHAQRLVSGPQPAVVPPMATGSGAAASSSASARNLESTRLVRPSGGKTVLWTGIALGILGLSVALIVLVLMPRPGRLLITATDPRGGPTSRLEIFVDGKKQCDTSPCLVDGVPSGSHIVKLIAAGFDPLERTIGVEPRKDTSVDFPLSTPGRGTGIRITGNQVGVKLFVDGREIGALPQEIRDLAPGDHKIRLVGSERYEPAERNISIGRDEMVDLGAIALKVIRGKATITLATQGAKVYLVSGNDKRDLPSFPLSVDIDTSKSWTIEASKPGYIDQKLPISFADGQAERVIQVELQPRGTAVAVAQTPTPPTGGRPHPPPRPRGGDSNDKDPPDDTGTTTTASTPLAADDNPVASSGSSAGGGGAGESFLNINSLPSSSLVLDGKPIGNTPKTHISVSAGSHNVTFVNAEQGLKKQVTVNVGAGETKTVIGKLRE